MENTPRRPSADALRPYRGLWVICLDGEVIFHGDSPEDVVDQLRAAGISHADSVFKVPMHPEQDTHK
jgi:hypothetical protein